MRPVVLRAARRLGGQRRSAAASASAESASPARAAAPAKVRLQLQWAPQAQFAGYFAAKEQGYYAAENLDVDDHRRWPDVAPADRRLGADGPEFTIALGAEGARGPRGAGSDLVDIAQIFQRSGTLSVSWKDTDIT